MVWQELVTDWVWKYAGELSMLPTKFGVVELTINKKKTFWKQKWFMDEDYDFDLGLVLEVLMHQWHKNMVNGNKDLKPRRKIRPTR